MTKVLKDHDQWVRERVALALEDTRPLVVNEEAMRRISNVLDSKICKLPIDNKAAID